MILIKLILKHFKNLQEPDRIAAISWLIRFWKDKIFIIVYNFSPHIPFIINNDR